MSCPPLRLIVMVRRYSIGLALLMSLGCWESDTKPETILPTYLVDVFGFVSDSSSHLPIAGAQVYRNAVGGGSLPSAYTDSTGYYIFEIMGRSVEGTAEYRATGYRSVMLYLPDEVDSIGPWTYRLDVLLPRIR